MSCVGGNMGYFMDVLPLICPKRSSRFPGLLAQMADPMALFQNAFYIGNNFNGILYGMYSFS